MIGLSVLIALVLYVYLAKVAIQFLGKRAKSKLVKYLTIAIFVLIPTWDLIPGRLYFNHLCKKEGGIKIFKTIEVDKSYFQANGLVDEKKLSTSGNFVLEHKDDRRYSSIFHIAKFESVLREKPTEEVLGVEVHLVHYDGWLNANLSPQGSVRRCENYSPYKDVWTEVIKKAAVTSEGGK